MAPWAAIVWPCGTRVHAPGFVDVTRGSNTVTFPVTGGLFTLRGYRLTPGYVLATGLGAVDAARLVPELAWFM